MIYDNDFGFINFIRQVTSYMQLGSNGLGGFYCFNRLDTRMGSKVMPPANFHRYCKRKDRIHVRYEFYILTSFIRCVNYTCRHNISREIYFYKNPSFLIGR